MVAEEFIKAAHGFGAGANLIIGFALDVGFENCGEISVTQFRMMSIA